MAKLNKIEMENYRKYHIPGTTNIHRLKLDAVFFNIHNTREHELKKAEICWEIKKSGQHFLSEAERNKKPTRRIDVVNLNGDEIEIVHKHETHRQVKEYREEGITVVIIDSFRCSKCKLLYPKRNKKNICRNCE